jgi:polyferredoxin
VWNLSKKKNMLRKTRRILALVVFSLTTLLFLDFTGTLHLWFGWLAKIQLIPAILAVNVAVIVGLALLTLLFGRLYCSVICPLGIFQDGISNMAGRKKGKKNRFSYSPAKSKLRNSVLGFFAGTFIIMLLGGTSVIVSLLDPYAAYGRIASNLFAPLYRWANNLLAWFAERFDSYAFYSVDVWIKGGISLGIAVVTILVIGALARRSGRTYCNTFCPVGTLLGLISRFSIFKVKFDNEKCTGCKLCERSCKVSCIDSENKRIDHSRCVS